MHNYDSHFINFIYKILLNCVKLVNAVRQHLKMWTSKWPKQQILAV